ncbi:MAG: heavy metal translocating P-type ATPase [Candidatus Margulisiibacteriota bacterium]|nr:MAG: heavy metal translocating P-type ATPase [Candidatus Margulisiibacteriota bacterium]HAR64416.1 heavy metal translocating P-type ATPase [Candidatus Margulisiibacteriota bacterium]HCY36946.1 heavy metal translocating P-type ATPase [Candidatus Margulisiibacteriota bacterium]
MAEHQHGEHDQHMHHDMNQGMKDRRQANMGHTGSGHSHHAMMIADFKRRFWISLVITIPILILSPVIQQFLGVGTSLRFTGDMYLLFIFSSIVYFYGGYPFLKGLIDEIKIKQPGMMTLVAVAITTAYLYSSAVVMGLMGEVFFWELATLIDIMLLGHWLEMKSIMGASRALEELARLMPSDAHKVMPDGSTRDVPLSELKLADKVLVKPGEKIPADGSVIEGITSVNESMLTGESNPVSKGTGAQVIGGAVNGEGSVTIEIRKTGKDSFLSQVIKLVNEAQQSKSKTQDLANRAAMWLTIIALGGGLITLLVWTILIKMNFGFSLERTVTVMVIACPHALGLAVPLVVAASTAIAARNGLLIRNRIAFEKARNIEAIIFDKTGTLTQGKFGVTDTVVIDKRYTAQDILQYAASVESHSEHPIAKGIVTAIKDIPTVEGFKSIPGKGAQGRVQGKTVLVVSPGYLRENNLKVDAPQIEKLTQQGKTVVFVIMEEKVAGAIALADIIRPESKQAVTELKRMGIRCLMLTGDNRQVAKWVAEEIGLDEYFAEVLPQDKASKVKEIQQRGLTVAMTGDGVNDAPALAQADVGIAIGAGTDVAAETADIILVRSNPLDAVAILGLARMTYSKMVQNLLWATGYNVFAIPLAAGVLYRYGILLTPAMGAVLMSVSTIIVAINATLFKMPGSQV